MTTKCENTMETSKYKELLHKLFCLSQRNLREHRPSEEGMLAEIDAAAKAGINFSAVIDGEPCASGILEVSGGELCVLDRMLLLGLDMEHVEFFADAGIKVPLKWWILYLFIWQIYGYGYAGEKWLQASKTLDKLLSFKPDVSSTPCDDEGTNSLIDFVLEKIDFSYFQKEIETAKVLEDILDRLKTIA